MDFQTKALYNLLKFTYLDDPKLKCESWQIEDLKKVGEQKLFDRLHKLGIAIDKEHFLLYAENCDGPEELTEYLIVDNETTKYHDQIYLIFFELWRRLLPERPSLSIFCDELDSLMHLYDKRELKTDEELQDALESLQDILEKNTDSGKDPKLVMTFVSKYLAHDLESFLYDYILDQIENGNEVYASELIDGFSPYFKNLKWFNFLRMKIVAKTDIIIANGILKNLLQDLGFAPDLDLQLEIMKSIVERGDVELFVKLALLTVDILKTEGDFLEFMEILADFYRRLDMDENDELIQKIIDKRAKINAKSQLKPDKDSLKIKELLKQPLKV